MNFIVEKKAKSQVIKTQGGSNMVPGPAWSRRSGGGSRSHRFEQKIAMSL